MKARSARSGLEQQAFRTRDLVALLAAVAAFFCATQTSSDAELVMTHFANLENRKGSLTPATDPRVPSPLVTDLDGDGVGELVLVSGSPPTLKVFNLPVTEGDEPGAEAVQRVDAVHEAALLQDVRVSEGRLPIAIGAGYLEPWGMLPPRQQRIVVVRQDWRVMCFSASLEMLWEIHVGSEALDELLAHDAIEQGLYELRDVAVLVTSQSASEDFSAGGTVFVSGRVQRKSTGVAKGFATQALEEESVGEAKGDGRDERSAQAEIEAEEGHFSFFALSGRDGQIVWSHTGSGPTAADAAAHAAGNGASHQARPQHQYRLDPATVMQAGGVGGVADDEGEDWTHFRASVLAAALPHAWDSFEDTGLSLAHFVRQHSGGRAAAARHAHRRKTNGMNKQDGGERGSRRGRALGKHSGLGKHGDHGHPSVRMPGLAASMEAVKTKKRRHKGEHQQHTAGEGQADPSSLSNPASSRTVPWDAVAPHLESEHLEKPNVVLAHTEHGIEAVTLHGGRPVFRLPLPRGGIYFDVNGDSVIDHLSVVEKRPMILAPGRVNKKRGTRDELQNQFTVADAAGMLPTDHLHGLAAHGLHSLRAAEGALPHARDHARLPPCTVLALSGIPAREQLFNGSLCSSAGAYFLSSPAHYRSMERRAPHQVRASVPSALVVPHGAFLGTLLAAQSAADGRTATHDTILLVSTGVVSSYASDGHLNWQRRDAPSWGDGADGYLVKVPISSQQRPSTTGVDFTALGSEEFITVGESSMKVHSTSSGLILAEVNLPEPPRRKPIVGDWNRDGATEVLLVGDRACWIFTLTFSTEGSGGFRLLIILVVMLALFIFFSQLRLELAGSSNRQSRWNAAGSKKYIARLPRSTD